MGQKPIAKGGCAVFNKEPIACLDHGYVRLVEAWGHGDAGVDGSSSDDGVVRFTPNIDYECGIIEAARQSTQGSFRGWEDQTCMKCGGLGDDNIKYENNPCPECNGKGKTTGDDRLLKYLFSGKPQHATPSEFAGMIVEIQAPIFVVRELQRHRTLSITDDCFSGDMGYNEMSARYAPLPDINYIPTVERLLRNSKVNKQAGTIKDAEELDENGALRYQSLLVEQYKECERLYQRALTAGVPKELARVVLPVGRYSRMRVTGYLRNWLAFITLRSDPNAQQEIQVFSNAVSTIVKQCFPRTWALYCEGKK